MTTPKTRVQSALKRQYAAHPPFTWGFGPGSAATRALVESFEKQNINWHRLRLATEDFAWLHPRYTGRPFPKGQAEYMAIWGIETRTINYGNGSYEDEIARNPLAGISDIAELADYPWPNVSDYDFASMNVSIRERDPEGKRAVRISGGNPFEIYCWMTGMEESMMNLIADPELVEAAMTHICTFFKAGIEEQVKAFKGEIDLVWIGDDLGTQHNLMMSLDTYRAIIKPFHRDLCEHIRNLLPTATIEYHSDGSVFDVLPDLMDAGVQMLEAVQVECAKMSPEELTETYGDRLMYQGAISVQQVLPFKTPAEVKAICRRLIDTLGRRGGFIAGPSHAVQVGTPTENILAMLEEVLGQERYLEALKY